MPNSSFLFLPISASYNMSIYPTNGTLVVEKFTLNRTSIRFISNDGTLYSGAYYSSDSESPWTGWIEIANAVDYLPLTGGTLSGSLTAKSFIMASFSNPIEIGQYIDFHNINSSGDYNLRLHTSSNGPGNLYLQIPDIGGRILYSSHNKPSGTYTGTGSATEFTINVGSIGGYELMVIYSSVSGGYVTIIVGVRGALAWHSSGEIKIYTQNEIQFYNAVLKIASDSSWFNSLGQGYRYTVL